MRRGALAAALIAAVAASTFAGPVTAGSGGDSTYKRYAQIRDQTRACVLDRSYRHLGAEKRRTCRRYRPLYVLYVRDGGESAEFHLHCLTSTCPRTPPGEPSARAAIPRGANVFKP